MVNPGHRSRGCISCKTAKTKCSEGSPCTRCAKRGSSCVYPELTFRSSNQWTPSTVQARVAPRPAARQPQQVPEEAFQSSHVPPHDHIVPADRIKEAVDLFFAEFVRQRDHLGSTWGSMTALPGAYGRSQLPYLTDAVTAAALAYSSNVSKEAELGLAASAAYGRACSSYAAILKDPNTAASDESLLCINLLAMYEMIAGLKSPSHLFFHHSHQSGQSAAVHLRLYGLDTPPVHFDRSALANTNRSLLWRDFADRKRPSLGSTRWPEDTYASWLDDASARVTAQAADICGRIAELKVIEESKWDEAFETSVAECIDEAQFVNRAIDACWDIAPPEWRPSSMPGNWENDFALSNAVNSSDLSNLECRIAEFGVSHLTHLRRDFFKASPDSEPSTPRSQQSGEKYSPRIDVYPSRPVSLLWNYVRCARIHLLRAMLDLRSIDVHPEYFLTAGFPSVLDIQWKLSDTIHDICASFPYAMGDIPGHDRSAISGPSADMTAITWILSKVCLVPGLSDNILQWAIETFERLANEKHISQCLSLAALHRKNQAKP